MSEVIDATPEDQDLHQLIAGFRNALSLAGFDHQKMGELLLAEAGAVLCHSEGRLEAVKTLRGLADELEKGFATLS